MIRFENVTKVYPVHPGRPSTTCPSRSSGASSSSSSASPGRASRRCCAWSLKEEQATSGHGLVAGHGPGPAAAAAGAAAAPPDRHGLPGLPAAAEQDGPGERRLRPGGASASRGTRSASSSPRRWSWSASRARRSGCPHELSGGEQQRVAIARAVVNRPMILIVRRADRQPRPVDQPSDIVRLLDRINRTGTTDRHGHPRQGHRRPVPQARHRARARPRRPRRPAGVRLLAVTPPADGRDRPRPSTTPMPTPAT